MRKSGAQSVERALHLLQAIIEDREQSSLAVIAAGLGLAPATAYRLAASLIATGMVLPAGRGRHVPGPAMGRLAPHLSLRPALVALGRPVVRGLARELGCVAHLGVLESDMVTYLVKEGPKAQMVFSEEGKQLEAYCSGVGKVLLAALDEDALDAYVSAGGFIALTPFTITDPDDLRREIDQVRAQGYAADAQEISLGLHCTAVAVKDPDGQAIAALSISRSTPCPDEATKQQILSALDDAARRLERSLFAAAARGGRRTRDCV